MNESGELCIRVTYRDKDLKPKYSKVYTLGEYTEMLQRDLMNIVSDVESLCYAANNNKQKEEWSDETFSAFCRIKHKLLDKAGEIKRIPENMTVKEPLSNYIARMIDKGE